MNCQLMDRISTAFLNLSCSGDETSVTRVTEPNLIIGQLGTIRKFQQQPHRNGCPPTYESSSAQSRTETKKHRGRTLHADASSTDMVLGLGGKPLQSQPEQSTQKIIEDVSKFPEIVINDNVKKSKIQSELDIGKAHLCKASIKERDVDDKKSIFVKLSQKKLHLKNNQSYSRTVSFRYPLTYFTPPGSIPLPILGKKAPCLKCSAVTKEEEIDGEFADAPTDGDGVSATKAQTQTPKRGSRKVRIMTVPLPDHSASPDDVKKFHIKHLRCLVDEIAPNTHEIVTGKQLLHYFPSEVNKPFEEVTQSPPTLSRIFTCCTKPPSQGTDYDDVTFSERSQTQLGLTCCPHQTA